MNLRFGKFGDWGFDSGYCTQAHVAVPSRRRDRRVGGAARLDAVVDIAGLDAGIAAATTAATGIGAIADVGIWLGLAFALGLVHAFDADHVIALSVLSTDERPGRGGVRAGLRWALGHGVVVLGCGAALLVLGQSLPADWVVLAERGVGAMMIGLGISVWISLLRRRRHLHFHDHDGLRPHAHWHSHAPNGDHPARNRHQHEHVASMVGALHGLAGAAPILALLPAAARSPGLGIAYLAVFGLGTALAMAGVSGLLGQLAERLSRRAHSKALVGLRAFSATGSVAIGAWLAISA